MILKEISECDIDKVYALLQAFPYDDHGFINEGYGLTKEEIKEYVKERKAWAVATHLPEGYVPCTTYVAINDNHEYVGIFNVRHELNAFLENGPGHIGYGIHKDYRLKGYGKAGLKIALEILKTHGVKLAYLSCYKDNAGSLAVQKACGAYIDHEDEIHYYTRIKL